MGKTKPSKEKKAKRKEKSVLNRVAPTPSKTPSSPAKPEDPLVLQIAATRLFHEGKIEDALALAKHTLVLSTTNSPSNPTASLPALNLLGELHVEIGDIESARLYFQKATELDPNGSIPEDLGGGAEKFLWLAQLSDAGGLDSVQWFEKGARALRLQIQQILDQPKIANSDAGKEALEEKRRKLATALCGVVEVYMTDLSWEEDAEQRCEGLVTEATMVASSAAEPWQTLASVRISQSRMDDARQALKRSLEVWKDLEPEDAKVPDFSVRVSLARLLMEAEMEDEALEVLERLVGEDDGAVEVWYLGGWGLYVLGEKCGGVEEKRVMWVSGRRWLERCLVLFEMQGYEDERLGEHARELVALLEKEVGGGGAGEEEEDWEDEDGEGSVDGDGDEDMEG